MGGQGTADKDPGPKAGELQSERIAKRMARSGLCSRRDAERWIDEGRVTLNGKLLASPAIAVTAADRITVDGNPLPERETTRLWLFHKKRGFVTTNKDPEGRSTVFEALPEALPRVMTIGRLDINTEGLLLLTNDGGLARILELPKTGWSRRYRVRAHGRITQKALDDLAQGITLEGVAYGPIEAKIEREQGSNLWLTMVLREGKNREIKNVLGALGLQVTRLIRVSFGPFQLADLAPGAVQEVKRRVLRDQLGPALAADLGVLPLRPGRDQNTQGPKSGSPKTRGPSAGGPSAGGPKNRGPKNRGPSAGANRDQRPSREPGADQNKPTAKTSKKRVPRADRRRPS